MEIPDNIDTANPKKDTKSLVRDSPFVFESIRTLYSEKVGLFGNQ